MDIHERKEALLTIAVLRLNNAGLVVVKSAWDWSQMYVWIEDPQFERSEIKMLMHKLGFQVYAAGKYKELPYALFFDFYSWEHPSIFDLDGSFEKWALRELSHNAIPHPTP